MTSQENFNLPKAFNPTLQSVFPQLNLPNVTHNLAVHSPQPLTSELQGPDVSRAVLGTSRPPQPPHASEAQRDI